MSKGYNTHTLKPKDARFAVTLPEEIKQEWFEMCKEYAGTERKAGAIVLQLMVLFLDDDFNGIEALSKEIKGKSS